MTEIKVILDVGTITNIGALSPEERELFFDQLAADNPDIRRVIIDSFAEMQTEMMREDNRLTKPALKELLLRKIIQLSQNYMSTFNTIIIPIVPNLTAVQGHPRAPVGGAFPPMRRMRPKEAPKRVEVPNAIKIRFDTQIFTTTISGLDYIVPSNEEIDVIGIIFNPICSPPMMIKQNGKLGEQTAIVVNPPTIDDRLIMGNYKYPNAARACDDYFVHPKYSIIIVGEELSGSLKFLFEELNDEKQARIFSAIFDYLANNESYNNIDSAQFIHTQLDVAIAGNPVANDLLAKKFVFEVSPSKPHEEPADKPEILKILEGIHYGRFSTVYELSVLADIDMRGFSRIYNKSILKGKDDPEVIEGINVHKDRKARIAFQNAIRKKLLDERNKLNSYKIIIEKKLGAERLREIERELALKPFLTVAAKNILDLLKPAERKPIELEFERKEKYLEAVLNNKCPHVKIYRQFRLARDDEKTKKLYYELKKFFKNPNETSGMIVCNNCGFDIICPHVRDFTEMDLSGKNYSEIKAKLTKYIDRGVVKDQYYCKICGEMISSLEAFGDVTEIRDPASMMNEDLKNFMWGEIAILTKYLKFGNLVNVPRLITAARDACYPYIFEIEKQILKSKTNSAEEIKAKKRLYVTIYAFAYFIHLILSNRGRVGENDISFKGFTPKNPKNIIVELIKYALDIIILSRNIIIREIPGMSPDIIKNTLIEAYKSMQNVGAQVIIYAGDTEDLLTTLMLDPIYHYFYTINVIDRILAGKKHIELSIDEVMGEPLAKLEKSKDIFASARVPKFDKWNVKAFDELAPLKKGKITHNSVLIWDEAYPGYVARSFEHFHGKLRARLYMEPMYVDVGTAEMNVKIREPHAEDWRRFQELEAREIELFKYRALMYAQNYYLIPVVKTLRWKNPGASLGRIYDEDGNPHVWDIYIVDESRRELKTADIVADIEAGIRFTGTIINRKCSICGILWSNVNDLSEQKIEESLRVRRVIYNFFRFYENRCPKGGLHDFGDGNKCNKCGIDNAYIVTPTSPMAIGYYREFKDIYARERAEFERAESDSTRLGIVAAKPPPDLSKYAKEYEKWTFNFNVVLDLANKIKVNHRLISALGAVEKQEYAEVQSGAYLPPEVDERYATRIYVVNTHVKNLITEYNQLRFFHRLVKPPIDLSTLIDKSGINKHKISELAKMLPEIYNDYNNRFLYMQRNKKPRETVAFCIQSFCEMCLTIYNHNNKETERLRHDFVDYFVKKVLRSEELLSKPGHFNWSLLYGDEKEIKEYDMNLNPDLEKESEKSIEETEEAEKGDFGDTSAPFSVSDFDMDGEEIEDPLDLESNEQDLNVGDNYGL